MMKNSALIALKAALLFTVSLLSSLPCFASGTEAVATVSNTVVSQNDVFQLTISVDDNVSQSDIDLLPLEQDFIYSTPTVSSSTSIINGKITKSTAWQLTLQPRNLGTFIIPSIQVGDLETLPISIQVVPDDAKQEIEQQIKIKGTVSNKTPYIGESFVYSLELMIGARVNSPRLQPPMGDGFEVVQKGKETQYESVINGRRYSIVNVNYQITAIKAGAAILQGAVLAGDEIRGNGFNALSLPFRRTAENIKFMIKNKPTGFAGFWLPTPDLQISQQWQQPDQSTNGNIKVGSTINRNIRLKIKDINQSNMPNLNLNYPDSVKVYQGKPSYSTDGKYTVMQLNQVIIPRQAGKIELPAISLDWFNTSTEKAQTSVIEGKLLNVEPALETNANIVVPSSTNTSVAKVTTVVEKNAGFWPYLTALFATLWLITTSFCIKSKNTEPKGTHAEQDTISFAELKAQIKANNTAKISAIYQKLDLSYLPANLQSEIAAEIESMLSAHYSASPSPWQNKRLLKLVELAEKQKRPKTTTSALAEL